MASAIRKGPINAEAMTAGRRQTKVCLFTWSKLAACASLGVVVNSKNKYQCCTLIEMRCRSFRHSQKTLLSKKPRRTGHPQSGDCTGVTTAKLASPHLIVTVHAVKCRTSLPPRFVVGLRHSSFSGIRRLLEFPDNAMPKGAITMAGIQVMQSVKQKPGPASKLSELRISNRDD